MYGWSILFVIGLYSGWSNALIEYTNPCGTISATQPAIHGKTVILQFVPANPDDDEGVATWHYTKSTWMRWYTVQNTSRHYFTRNASTHIMYLTCDEVNDKDRMYAVEFTAKSGEECSSESIVLDIIEAPSGCGLLYKQSVNIIDGQEVVMEYYAPDTILQNARSVRWLNRVSRDCDETIGCPINETLYDEEFRKFNDVYVLSIHAFTNVMNGDYRLQCTNGGSHNLATNTVRLVIPVPPKHPLFLDTTDIGECRGCISGKYHSNVKVRCHVVGGTYPVTVTITLLNDGNEGTCQLTDEYEVCDGEIQMLNRYHMTDIQCAVSNEATDAPLTTTSKLYVITRPSTAYLYAPTQYEGNVDIYCKSSGTRPMPELMLLVNESTVVNTTDVVKDDERRIKLDYLYRSWNGAEMGCCVRHPYYEEPRCTTKTLSYYFSPESINMTQIASTTVDNVHFIHTLQCSVINASPACRVKWSYPDHLDVTIGADKKLTVLGGETTLSTLVLNTTKDMNGGVVQCRAVCTYFNVSATKASYTIRVPYSPTIAINASNDDSRWLVGESISVRCEADSYPLAELSWYNERNEKMPRVDCGEWAVCLRVARASMRDAGLYTCKAETEMFETQTKSIRLNIQDTSTEKQTQPEEKTPLTWIVAGLGTTLVAIVLVIVIVILRKRNARTRKQPETENHSMKEINGNTSKGENPGTDTYDTINDSMYANTNSASVEDRPMLNKAPVENSVPEDTEYAVVIPKSQRQQHGVTEAKHDQAGSSGNTELVYADLDLETTGASPTTLPNQAEQTEYVSIDFNKIGEQLPDDEDAENIYVNQ